MSTPACLLVEAGRVGLAINRPGRTDTTWLSIDNVESRPSTIAALLSDLPVDLRRKLALVVATSEDQSYLVKLDQSERRSTTRSLAYSVESLLPLDAEEMVLRDLGSVDGHRSVMVLEQELVAGVLDGLGADAERLIAWIPAALLVLAAQIRDRKAPLRGWIALKHGAATDLIGLNNGSPIAWFSKLDGSYEVAATIETSEGNAGSAGSVIEFRLSGANPSEDEDPNSVGTLHPDWHESIKNAAFQLAAGKLKSPAAFRLRDLMAGTEPNRSALFFDIGVAAALVMFAIGWLWEIGIKHQSPQAH